MWSTRKRRSRSRLGHDEGDMPAFDTAADFTQIWEAHDETT